MQIHRFDVEPHSPSVRVPKGRAHDARGIVNGSEAESSQQSGSATESRLRTLTGQLRELPEVRSEVVARIRQQVADGVYSSRESAEATAAAIVRSDT